MRSWVGFHFCQLPPRPQILIPSLWNDHKSSDVPKLRGGDLESLTVDTGPSFPAFRRLAWWLRPYGGRRHTHGFWVPTGFLRASCHQPDIYGPRTSDHMGRFSLRNGLLKILIDLLFLGAETPCSRCDKSQKLRRDKAWSFWRGENAPNDWTGKGQRVLGMGGTVAVTWLAHSLQILAGGLSVNLASPCHSVIEGKFRQGLLLSLDFWSLIQTFPVLWSFWREAFAKDHLFLENDIKHQHWTCQNLN